MKMGEENEFQSNHIFYYPSSRLTPWAIAQDELCPFWCLLDGEGEAFLAEAGLKSNVDKLVKAIQEKKSDLCGLDSSKIVLLKLNDPIQLDPEETLLQRLPKSITDSSVKLRHTRKLSNAFPDRTEDSDYLQIIVTLHDQPALKKRRMNSPELDVSEDWNLLWHTFWGKQALNCFVQDSTHIPDLRTLGTVTQETSYDYVTLPNNGILPCGLRRILITETYKSLYTKLCEQDKLYTKLSESKRLTSLTHSTIVTGQPGTGKTAGLSWILVRRLQEKKMTVYCNDDTCAYVFSDSGVNAVSLKNRKRIEELDKSTDCCALVDVNEDLMVVPSQFRPSERRRGRVVVASSPRMDHVTTFHKDRGLTFYTPTWNWTDLYCAGLLWDPSVDAKQLQDAYTMLGGIPRRCFRWLRSDGNKFEMQQIQHAIDNIDDIQDFAQSATGFMPFKLEMTHALVRLEPRDATWKTHNTQLLSNHVASLVYERIRLHETMKIRDSIEALLCKPYARSWGGQLFEMAVHRVLRDGFVFEPMPLDAGAPRLDVKINKAANAEGYFHKLSIRAKPKSRDVANKFLNQYLIPLSSTAEAIDSASVSKEVTVLVQITVSPTHDLNLKGITGLVNDLPFNAKKRICIVFIVPGDDEACKAYKRQSIIVPPGVPKAVSDPVVEYNQYVYYFPMAKL